MTVTELEELFARLETLAPSSRVSEKRQLLTIARERIIALRRRGHSWRALAREISAALGQHVSADLLRAACAQRAPLRRHRRDASAIPAPEKRETEAPVTPPKPAPQPSSSSFGARGLKL